MEGSALADPERSPRELAAWKLTDLEGHFLSESSVYRILKAYNLIPSPAFIVLSAAKTFRHPTRRPNKLWQTDFTYLQVVGWGWGTTCRRCSMTMRGTSSPGCCGRRCRPLT